MTRPGARWLVPALIGIELSVSLLALRSGFVAVSDDDFARVVIAQRFAALPRLDPSGTSWLPLPFVVLGTAMLAFGRGLGVARVVAVVQGMAAILLVYRAARNLSLSERAAFTAAVIASALPTAARLVVSFQPEAVTAGLVVFGASTLSRDGRERLLGGLALGAATLCRYEAWPAAVAFSTLSLMDPRRRTGSSNHAPTIAGAVAAFLPALLWMVHGTVAHGSPIFFLHRVSAYRQALGGRESIAGAIAAYPAALFRSEPELVLAAAASFIIGVRDARRGGTEAQGPFQPFARLTCVVAAIFLFLIIGRLMGGAPTHHDERALLSIFWVLALVVGRTVSGGLVAEGGLRRLALIGALGAAGLLVRFARVPEPFDGRATELAIGADARRRVGQTERLLVETGDYGYFAVMAAFESPDRAEPFDDRDPRGPRARDAFSSPATLGARLSERHTNWFVAPNSTQQVAAMVGSLEAQNDRFSLFRVSARR